MLSAGVAVGRAFNLKVRDTLSWSQQVEAVENVARGCGRSMTRFEFACPQCRQTIIAWARLLTGAIPDPSTAIMLQCKGLSLSCGWTGAQLLHTANSASQQFEAIEDVG
jgi:hypothetical protein